MSPSQMPACHGRAWDAREAELVERVSSIRVSPQEAFIGDRSVKECVAQRSLHDLVSRIELT